MKSQVKRIALLVVGWTFIVLGIAGLFLPFLQGVLFLLIGLFILSGEYVWAHKLLHRLKERFPKIAARFEHGRQRAEAWMSGTFRGKSAVKSDGAAD
jgi:uncharacterized membrane protein YbaN (DUF454 family)